MLQSTAACMSMGGLGRGVGKVTGQTGRGLALSQAARVRVFYASCCHAGGDLTAAGKVLAFYPGRGQYCSILLRRGRVRA